MPLPDRPEFTLTVVTSADGYIARAPDDPPQNWASAEEQALFFADVEAADWAIMGRHTHEAADRPDRRPRRRASERAVRLAAGAPSAEKKARSRRW